jgi:hypothetical protein
MTSFRGYKMLDGNKLKFTGVRAPSLERKEPPVWGNPINLLTDNMDRWIIPENNKFVMEDGVMVNKEKGGNLITNQKFDDFKLSIEFRYPEGSNSGIYLRGRHELQIEDSKGRADRCQYRWHLRIYCTSSECSQEAGRMANL